MQLQDLLSFYAYILNFSLFGLQGAYYLKAGEMNLTDFAY